MRTVWLCLAVLGLSCGGDDGGGDGCPDGTVARGGLCVPDDADGDADADSDSDADADADSDADADGDGDADGDADADADADGDADSDGDADGDADVTCDRSHPILNDLNGDGDFIDEGERTCAAGDTYCVSEDTCYADAVAGACCVVDVACDGTHPLINDLNGDGDFADPGERTCGQGDIYCEVADACFADAVALACCG